MSFTVNSWNWSSNSYPMKKKVLFIIGTLQSGGVSKSMVSLLNAWDKEKYDTSLLLCSKQGDVFSSYLPKNIPILWDRDIEDIHSGIAGIRDLLFRARLLLALGCILRLVLSKISKSLAGRLIAMMMPIISEEEYDLIVDYGGQQQLYYMVDKLNGKRKVTFFHNDYSKWPYYYKADRMYYPKVDHIFSISQVCVDALKHFFPECADKISVMENISSPEIIRKQATEEDKSLKSLIDCLKLLDCAHKATGTSTERRFGNISSPGNHHPITILCTVAHFCRRKGSDFAIEAAGILKKKGVKYKWLFVGKVLEPDLIKLALINGLKIIDLTSEEGRMLIMSHDSRLMAYDIFFCGIRSNPYPYMKEADIYVQPSRFEGKSISLDEAKILGKSIVVTNFSTVHDQFENGVNASICEMNGISLANSIEELTNNKAQRSRYEVYLSRHVDNNCSEVSKLYVFLE